ncbi:hypothetical protein GOC13_07390 [Sinorhizobium meliloti]|nr:hypothetical protein [Sinorhizobium meliloti]
MGDHKKQPTLGAGLAALLSMNDPTHQLRQEVEELRARRDELLVANNRYQQEARDARAEIKRLRERLLA